MSRTYRTLAWCGAALTVVSVAGLAVFFLTGLAGCFSREQAVQAQPGTPPTAGAAGASAASVTRVKVVRSAREHLKRMSTPQPAHVAPYEKTDLYAKVAGYLETFGQVMGADGALRPVDIGDKVTKGQVLARLSVPEMEQERLQKAALVAQAEAELVQATAALTAALAMVDAAKAKIEETRSQLTRYAAEVAFRRSEYQRYAAMVKDRAVRRELEDEKLNQLRAAEANEQGGKAGLTSAQANLEVEEAKVVKARADVQSAKARIEVAKANLQHTVILLGYATIKAPYDGIITRRLLDTGAFVQSAASGKPEPLFTLARVDRLRILADIPEAEAGLVRVGQRATLLVEAARGQALAGKVARVSEALESSTRTMRTEVELDPHGLTLRPGMFGSVTITLADVPDALLLPVSARLPGGGKPAVWVVEAGRVHKREIDLGMLDGVRGQVLRGLTEKEQVVADGRTPVKDGQAVEVSP